MCNTLFAKSVWFRGPGENALMQPMANLTQDPHCIIKKRWIWGGGICINQTAYRCTVADGLRRVTRFPWEDQT